MPVSACVKTYGTCVRVNLPFLAGVLSLLYVQGEHVHRAGPRQVGPAIYLILYTAEP